MKDELQTDSFLTALLYAGCSERQMRALSSLVDVMEKEAMALHLQIHGMRSLAHTQQDNGFARLADAVLHSSNSLLIGLRQQQESLARVVIKEPAAARS